MSALEKGETPPENVVEIRQPALLTEFEDTGAPFGNPGAMTVIVGGGLKHELQHTTRISVHRGQTQALEQVGLLKLGAEQGPWTHDVNKVALAQVPILRTKLLSESLRRRTVENHVFQKAPGRTTQGS